MRADPDPVSWRSGTNLSRIHPLPTATCCADGSLQRPCRKPCFPLSRLGFPALTLSSPYSCGSGDNGYSALTPERSGLSPAARSVRLHRVVVKQDGHRAGRGGGVGLSADGMSPGARRSIRPGRAFLRGSPFFVARNRQTGLGTITATVSPPSGDRSSSIRPR